MKFLLSRLSILNITLHLLMICVISNAYAAEGLFDGKRKGFVLGISAEPGVSLWTSDDSEYSDIKRYSLFDVNITAGYGVTDKMIIYTTSRFGKNRIGNIGYSLYDTGARFIDYSVGLSVMYFPVKYMDLYLRPTFCLYGNTYNDENISNKDFDVAVGGAVGYEIFPHITFDISLSVARLWDSNSNGKFSSTDYGAYLSLVITRLFY